jgi:gliding motility-associated-like protein
VCDIWNIPALEAYPNATIDIYNRYGEKVFSSTSGLKQWNGRYKGKDVPVGAYYYVIRLQDPEQNVTGSIMVLR